MKEHIKLAIQDKIIRITLGLSLVIITLLVIGILLFVSHFPPIVPFFNSLPWGVDRLAPLGMVMLLPPVLIFIFLLNYVITFSIYKKHTLIARILAVNALLFIFLGFLAYLQIALWMF